ncbi:branched-chain amino acid aminotransferase [Calditrichota bacterium LG25]
MERAKLDWSNLAFQYVKTDYHLEYYFKDGKWSEANIVESDRVELHIAATALHYGQQCFEGLKAFERADGRVSVFRVDENAKRMKRSAEKILMEPFPEDKFIEAVFKVVQLNRRFVPPYGSGASLYVRPLLIGTSGVIGVKPSTEYMFLIFVMPVGPYFKGGLKPIRLLVEEEIDRAAPLGVGDVKVGGNYAAGLRASHKAKSLGYNEVLYLDAKHKKYIDESGPANFFGITQDNKYVTPASSSILPSITNMSLRTLAEEELGMKVEQRPIDVEEIFDFKEAGCCGTAAVITPVKSIKYRDREVTYLQGDEVGPVCRKLYDTLTGIQLGTVEDKYGWSFEIPMD